MKKVEMFLIGCDDETYIELDVTDEELFFLKRLERISKEKSSYSCQPILEISSIDGVKIKEEKTDKIIF